MPQDVDFDIPLPARYNPHHDQAERHNLEWLRHHRMLVDSKAVALYRSWELADLAARCWPECKVDDLALTVDAKSFYFLFDDQFDGPQGQDPASVAAVCQELIDIAQQDPAAAPRSPVATAFADLWARSREGMSRSWVTRTAHDWERYFASYPHEAVKRCAGVVPTMDDYLTIRRSSAATESVTDMVERLNRIEVPPIAFHSPELQLMRQIAADVPFMCNDVYSYEKETARGDVYNLVTVLCRERRYSVAQATEEIKAMVAERVRRFLQLRAQVPNMLHELGLSDMQLRYVGRYMTGLGDWLRGHNDWMTATIRYRTGGSPPPDQPGHLDPLLD
ncbi:terpene cyclase [Streptomyces sp. NPDC050147]|uniref:terpene synthase family protein n=1 Tax=Streptomyces sp. NPDC050147 TaxID=3155513 RepID=UPI003448B3B8